MSVTGKPAPEGYDWSTSNTSYRYSRMRDALLAQDRGITFSICDWGHARVDTWGNATGHSWRMWGDIYPEWQGFWGGNRWGIMPILNHAAFFTASTNFWGHNDYDMLEVGNGNLTYEESRSHFAFWAALKSPLIIGPRLDGIKPEILEILSNPELIAFRQDNLVGESAMPYKWGINPDGTWNQTHPAEFWAGKSSVGDHVFVLNTLNETVTKTVVFGEVPGLTSGKKYLVHDMWTGEDVGVFSDEFDAEIKGHDSAAFRVTEKKKSCRSRV